MSIRIPLTKIKSVTDTATTSTVNYDFILPQDINNLVAKMSVGTFTGTSPTADVSLQTTDDGGTTWYNLGAFAQVTTAITNANALFITIPVDGTSARTNGYTGAAAAAGTASYVSGVPVLSPLCRLAITYGGTIGVNAGITVTVMSGSQASHQ